jgi:hypothetical protein
MTEIVLNTSTLPEPLLRLIRAEKVKVRETDGEIRLTPILETGRDCPLLGLPAGSGLTVDKFLALSLHSLLIISYGLVAYEATAYK